MLSHMKNGTSEASVPSIGLFRRQFLDQSQTAFTYCESIRSNVFLVTWFTFDQCQIFFICFSRVISHLIVPGPDSNLQSIIIRNNWYLYVLLKNFSFSLHFVKSINFTTPDFMLNVETLWTLFNSIFFLSSEKFKYTKVIFKKIYIQLKVVSGSSSFIYRLSMQ